MDERFCVPDFDLEDDDPVAGECFECYGFSRLLDVDMLCPKCRPTKRPADSVRAAKLARKSKSKSKKSAPAISG